MRSKAKNSAIVNLGERGFSAAPILLPPKCSLDIFLPMSIVYAT